MATLYLVRHGQTDWNAERRWQGERDLPLNEEGLRQAEAVAGAFRAVRVDRVFSSDLRRARDTAAALAQATGAPHVVLPSLRERAFGRWEGRTNEEILREYPDEMAQYQKDRDLFTPPGGQSWADFAPTAVRAVETIGVDHTDQHLAIVAHGGPFRAFINHVLGIERGPLNQFVLDNGSISTVVRRKHEIAGQVWWQITALNITCHLNDGRRLSG